MKKIILFLLLAMPQIVYALEDVSPYVYIFSIINFLSVIAFVLFIIFLIIYFIKKKHHQKNIKIEYSIIITGLVWVIPFLTFLCFLIPSMTFDYQVHKNSIDKIRDLNTNLENVLIYSWKTPLGRIYGLSCQDSNIYINQYNNPLIKKVEAKNLLSIVVTDFKKNDDPMCEKCERGLRLGCSPNSMTYFNANGDYIDECGFGLKCPYLNKFNTDNIDYINPESCIPYWLGDKTDKCI